MALIELEHFKKGYFLDDLMSFLRNQGVGSVDGKSFECAVLNSEKNVKIQRYDPAGNGAFHDLYSDTINYLPFSEQGHLYTKLGGASEVMSGIFTGCVMAKYRKVIDKEGRGGLVKNEGSRNLKGDVDFNNMREHESNFRFGHIFIPPGANGGGKADAFFKVNKEAKFEVCFKPMYGDMATLAELKQGVHLPNGLQFIGANGLNTKVDGCMGIITASNATYRFFVSGVRQISNTAVMKLLILSDCEQVDNSYHHAG
jgi:hypothetical protein